MYRTTIEAGEDGISVAREFSINPETSPYSPSDVCKEPDSKQARRMLAHAKLEPLVLSTGLTFFISEVSR